MFAAEGYTGTNENQWTSLSVSKQAFETVSYGTINTSAP